MKPSEALKDLNKLKYQMEVILRNVGGEYMDNVEEVTNDPEEAFIRYELHSMIDKLDDVEKALKYLALDVVEIGPLELNSDERFELPSGYTYTSGSTIELLHFDNFWKVEKWLLTSIEHTEGHYYATALGKDVDIEGLTARRRERKY